jgi:PAS domain S-box-containing protein
MTTRPPQDHTWSPDGVVRRSGAPLGAETRRTDHRLRLIMDSAPVGILGLDASGRVVDGNPAAETLFGARIEDLFGQAVPSLLEQVPPPGVRLETRVLGDQEDGPPVEVVLQTHPDGSGSTLVLRDIRGALADRRQLETHAAELERLNAELTTLDAMKRDFVSMASHEVRTPITAIRGFSLTLSRRWDELSDADRIRCFEVIHRQTDRLWRVIDDLLVASRIEAGAVDAEHMPTNVATVVARAIDDAGVPRSQVVVVCPSDLDVIVARDHLRRIITAYLTNARKYGAPPFEVEAHLDLEQGGDGVTVWVRDRGPGVDESFTGLLFDTFTQASTGINRTSSGTGLGLAVARGLAESVGGRVWYENDPSGGACFGVRLPTLRQPDQRWAAPEAHAARSAAS